MTAKKSQAVKPEVISKEVLQTEVAAEEVIESEVTPKEVSYEVIETFKDVDGVIYPKGSKYPSEKSKPAEERYDALLTENNKMKRPFIREV